MCKKIIATEDCYFYLFKKEVYWSGIGNERKYEGMFNSSAARTRIKYIKLTLKKKPKILRLLTRVLKFIIHILRTI